MWLDINITSAPYLRQHVFIIYFTVLFVIAFSAFHSIRSRIFHPLQRSGKAKSLDTCYSATYMSQTRDQQRFTVSEVAANWHEPMVTQRIMLPSIARANGQLDPRCS